MDVLQRLFAALDSKTILRRLASLGALLLLITLVIVLATNEVGGVAMLTLLAGLVGVGAWVLFAPDEISAWLSGRQVYYGTGSVLLVVAVTGIAMIGYSLALDQNIVVDLTETEAFTIGQPSIDVLRTFEETLQRAETVYSQDAGLETTFAAQLIGFYGREELRDQKSAEYLLRQFTAESNGSLTLDFVDPDIEPAVARQFGYGLTNVVDNEVGGPVFLAVQIQNERENRLRVENIGVPDERTVQNALRRILVDFQFKFYFIQGHQELDPFIESDLGISAVYASLPAAGFAVDVLNLREAERIPDDATGIIIAGAVTPYSQSDVDKIRAYMDGGGRMLILADPPYADQPIDGPFQREFLLEDSSFNQYLWEEFGVRALENIISDQGSRVSPSEFLLTGSGINVNTAQGSVLVNFPESDMLLSLTRSINIALAPEPATNQAAYTRNVLILPRETAFGERNLTDVDRANLSDYDEGVDDAGPLFIAASVRRLNEVEQDIQPRLIIMGDSDWILNAYIAPEDGTLGLDGNVQLWGRLIEWLSGSTEFAEIDVVNRPDLLPLTANQSELNRIQIVTLLVMPGLAMVAGVAVWAVRRRH